MKNSLSDINKMRKNVQYLLQPGAGTIKPDIISSLITGGSDGGGGHTNESIISSVTLLGFGSSGGSVRDDLNERTSCHYIWIFDTPIKCKNNETHIFHFSEMYFRFVTCLFILDVGNVSNSYSFI